MANLPKGTTINNTPIIVDSTRNDHRHNTSSVIGLNEDVQGGGEIYAEFIDGVSYEQIQSTFVSENNNTMTGILSVTSGNNTNNIVSKSIVDNILISRGVKDYSLSSIPSTSETQAINSIVYVGSSGSIDTSWLPGSSTSVNSNVSISGVPSTVDSDTNYEFKITNFDAFSNYITSVNIGSTGIYGDGILWYNAPNLSRNEQNVILTIEKNGSEKNISFTLSEDLPLSLSILVDGSYENIPSPLVIDSTDTIRLRIDSYKSGYNYTVSGDLLNHGFTYTITADIITLHPPATLIATTTSLIIGDGYDTVVINIDVQNTVYYSWIVSTLGGSSSDIYQSVIQSNDGGYVAVGYQASQSQGSNDALIVKYDANLNVIKQASLGGSRENYYFSVTQSSDSGYVAVGNQNSQTQSGTGYDGLIVKYDSNLNVVKQLSLGGVISGGDLLYSVIQSTDGGYVAVGDQQTQNQAINPIALIVKYDSDLNQVAQSSIGELNYEHYQSVTQSADGGYIAVGFQGSQSQGSYDALIVKYDANLNVIKQASLGGSGADEYRSVIQSIDGGYVAVGFQGSQSQGDYDALIVKYDSNLNVIKQASLGGSGRDYYQSVTQSADGGYVAVGYQASQSQGIYDALIVKYDANLNVIKQAGLSSSTDIYYSVVQSNDGGYVAVGIEFSGNQGNYDALITKLPSDLLIEGAISNHSGLVWTEPTLTVTTPTLTATTTTLTVTTTTLTDAPLALTATTPTLVETRSEKI